MEQSAPFETVTKLEAAERQLRVAIRMFFERKDMIAVHTVAAAAQGVLRDLGRPKEFLSVFEEGASIIVPEKKAEFTRQVRGAQNFFKHADRNPDPDEKLEFYFDATKFYLFDATRLLLSMTGRHTPETAALTAFFLAKYPKWFKFDNVPLLQMLKGLAATLPVDDFEAMIIAMDGLRLNPEEGQHKVNMT